MYWLVASWRETRGERLVHLGRALRCRRGGGGGGVQWLFTYGVDPDAEIGGVEGHCQGVGVGVDGHRVSVDGSGQQGRRGAIIVQHRRQQRRRLRLRAAHGDRHALSWRHIQ